jgi:rhodanese-related sulfurtransferase
MYSTNQLINIIIEEWTMKNRNRRFRDAIYEQFARIGKAVSSPKRLELLDLLCQGERTVEALAKEAGLAVANASQHLQVLRGARLIEAEKVGLFVIYRLADQSVCEFFRTMRILAENRLAEVEQIKRQFLAGREGMEPVDRDELLKRVREGAVTVLDVRPTEEYRAAHIPGALSIPLKELKRRLSQLPRDREIVAYCRGPYCVLTIQAVEILRAKGFHAVRLEEGIPDWRAMGFPVAVGEETK